MNPFARTQLLFGRENMERLARARVAVFGLGGVGGHAAEALARSGVGALDLIDDDRIAPSNINRQIFATWKTVGQYKTEAARERILEISPGAVIRCHQTFYTPESADQFCFGDYDYVVDAIDTVTGKLELAVQAAKAHTPIISSMGAGNKMDPTAFQVADIYETSVCPLARVMRRELKKRGITHLKVVYSREKAMTPFADAEAGGPDEGGLTDFRPGAGGRRQIPGSNAFVPSVVGLIMAGEVIRDLCDPKTMAKTPGQA